MLALALTTADEATTDAPCSPLTPSAPPRRSARRSAAVDRQTPPTPHTTTTPHPLPPTRALPPLLCCSFSDSRSPGPPTHLPNPPLVHHQPSSLFGPRPRSRTLMVRGRGRGPNRPPSPVSIGQQQPVTPDPRSGVQSGGKSTPESPDSALPELVRGAGEWLVARGPSDYCPRREGAVANWTPAARPTRACPAHETRRSLPWGSDTAHRSPARQAGECRNSRKAGLCRDDPGPRSKLGPSAATTRDCSHGTAGAGGSARLPPWMDGLLPRLAAASSS